MKIILWALVATFLTSCNSKEMKELNIIPIDSEFNHRLQFNIQYYEIENFENKTDRELIKFISTFSASQISSKIPLSSDLTMLFYEKKPLVNYSNFIYHAAEENEFGGIERFKNNLVAKVWYKTRADESILQLVILYRNGKNVSSSEQVIYQKAD